MQNNFLTYIKTIPKHLQLKRKTCKCPNNITEIEYMKLYRCSWKKGPKKNQILFSHSKLRISSSKNGWHFH